MKALFIQRHGSLEEVRYGETPKPEMSTGEVLVRMKAAALNHLDLFVVEGIPGIEQPLPHVLGSDGAGVVEAVADKVTDVQPGDRVMLNPCLWCGRCEFCVRGEHSLCIRFGLVGEHCSGTFAEYFCVKGDSLEKIPFGVSFEEAAAFSLVFQTAWRMLVTQAEIKAGEDVFIHGVGGGVSSAALQIVKLCGGRAFVSSSSDEKLEKARRMGADYCYNYASVDISEALLKDTHKRGVDIVIDNVGASTWLQSLKLVCKGGRIVTCGATTGPNPATEIRLIFWKQISIKGSTMSTRHEYRSVVRLLGQRKLIPVIDQVLPLSRGKEALTHLQQGRQFGKIVLASQ